MFPTIHGVVSQGGVTDAPSAFTPTDLNDLVLWLDASDASTITESNGSISEWRDKSGNGFHATQATSSRQPTLVSNVLNGKPVIQFDGSDFLTLSGASAIARNVAGFTAFAVANSTTTGTQRILHINTNDPGHVVRFAVYKSSSGVAGVASRRLDGESVVSATTLELTSTHAILSGVADYANGSLKAYFNGGNEATTAMISSGNTSNTSSSQVRVGAVLDTAAPSGEAFLEGDVAEIVAYRRALTPTERGQVEAYLAEKWGISI